MPHARAIAWIRSIGLTPTLRVLLYKLRAALGLGNPRSTRIRPLGFDYPLEVRIQHSSDLLVFHQIFVFQEYEAVGSIEVPRFILDVGANVGYSSAYFLARFPTARVVALEPEPGNYRQCRENVAPYGDRIRVIPGALWKERCRLAISRGTFGDGREWATQVVRPDATTDAAGTVEAWDMQSLLDELGENTVDLLKLDIERSELDVFASASCNQWLPRVRNLCIELHGQDCRDVFPL